MVWHQLVPALCWSYIMFTQYSMLGYGCTIPLNWNFLDVLCIILYIPLKFRLTYFVYMKTLGSPCGQGWSIIWSVRFKVLPQLLHPEGEQSCWNLPTLGSGTAPIHFRLKVEYEIWTQLFTFVGDNSTPLVLGSSDALSLTCECKPAIFNTSVPS